MKLLEPHLVGKDAIDVVLVQQRQPVEAYELVVLQRQAPGIRGRERKSMEAGSRNTRWGTHLGMVDGCETMAAVED
jgi:hypothetical protein